MSMDKFHFITHTHSRDRIISKFECTAPDTAECHTYPNCDCESPCEHADVQQHECWIKPWMDDNCAEECFVGTCGQPVRGTSPIIVRHNGDCVEWVYGA